ncbi:MAG: hypothetical protein RSC91_03040 [Clostridia bacterium]
MRQPKMFLALVLVFTALCGQASAISGQRYDTFLQNYQDDVTFININDTRHLLPLVFSTHPSEQNDGRIYYELLGDVLSASVRTDPSGEIIEFCQITMTAPLGMSYGSAQYNDFAISGYHSYALLMAMHSATEALDRYALVVDVLDGMARGDGSYKTQLGVYTLTCTRVENCATLIFENTQSQSLPGLDPQQSAPPASPEPSQEGGEGTSQAG